MLFLLFVLFHWGVNSELINFNDQHIIYSDNKYVDILEYSFLLTNNYSDSFIVFSNPVAFYKFCHHTCSGKVQVKSLISNITIFSHGMTELSYSLNFTYADDPSRPHKNNIIIVMAVIGGIIVISIMSTILWYLIYDRCLSYNLV